MRWLALTTVLLLLPGAVAQYTPHPPISIYGDGDFLLPGNGVVSGTGTEEDPYIIEGWSIDGSRFLGVPLPFANGVLIDIRTTAAHFIIRDLQLTPTDEDWPILLVEVANGIIGPLELEGGVHGVRADDTVDLVIHSSRISGTTPISIHGGSGARISDNVLATDHIGAFLSDHGDFVVNRNEVIGGDAGIWTWGGAGTIEANRVRDQAGSGILLIESSATRVSLNAVMGTTSYGIDVSSSTGAIIENNVVDGTGLDSPHAGGSSLSIENSRDVKVANNTFTNSGREGIGASYNEGLLIQDNLITGHAEGGFHANGLARGYRIINNTITDNGNTPGRGGGGLFLRGEDNLVMSNIIQRNGDPRGYYSGIDLTGSGNEISWNLITDNPNGGVHVWYESHGNRIVDNEVRDNGEDFILYSDGNEIDRNHRDLSRSRVPHEGTDAPAATLPLLVLALAALAAARRR